MARPRHNPTDAFSDAELAIGGGITKRQFQHIADNGQLPPGSGRDIRALKRVAAIGAFVSGGMPVLLAGYVFKTLLSVGEFDQEDGEVPSGLSHLARKLPANIIRDHVQGIGDYWYHRGLYFAGEGAPDTAPGINDYYLAGEPLGSDAIFEIIDRQYLFVRNIELKTQNPWADRPETVDAMFVGWIEGWSRSEEFRVVHITERAPLDKDWGRPMGQRLQAQATDRRNRAVATLTINVSLAIRNALDRVAVFRAERKAEREAK
ncbi:MAG: hypothetical protein EOS27_16555 [Mesorhizobium sp.]|nr:MAG: hypothetical protein EOS27_16555 [Mesorhizobium sp.]